jgi:nucleoside-diphosphate-sugar epimerase
MFRYGLQHKLRSFTFVGDIVDGIFKAVQKYEQLNGEIINLGTEEEHTTQQGIAYVEELLGLKIGMEIIPERPGDQIRTLANIDKARKFLGYNPPTSLKEGLKLQIDWYKTEWSRSAKFPN